MTANRQRTDSTGYRVAAQLNIYVVTVSNVLLPEEISEVVQVGGVLHHDEVGAAVTGVGGRGHAGPRVPAAARQRGGGDRQEAARQLADWPRHLRLRCTVLRAAGAVLQGDRSAVL